MTFGKFWYLTTKAIAMPAGVLALALALPLSEAQAQAKKADLEHTSIHWTVWHGGFSKVVGQFRQVNRFDLIFDRNDVSKSKVSVEIEAASLDSNHYFRDNWARSDAELNVWKFRTIKFESTKIEKTGDNKGTMTGDLTIRDVTRPITLEVTYNKGGKHISGKYSIDGFTATGKLKRSDFGLKAFIPWIGDDMEIMIQTEAVRPNDPS
jgi:polyisoprenoid-binding protein YceI